jgi:tRNA-dihydrouridine synthase
MVGRGAYGRPWFPAHVAAYSASGIQPRPPSGLALAALVQRHYEAMLVHYGESLGVRCARKHLGWYADRLAAGGTAAAIRRTLLSEIRPKEVLRLIPLLFGEQETGRAAA